MLGSLGGRNIDRYMGVALMFVATNDAVARQSLCPTGFHGSRERGVGTGPIWRGEPTVVGLFGGMDITAVTIPTQGSDCNLCAGDSRNRGPFIFAPVRRGQPPSIHPSAER
jgi:hypothetical protein